MKPAGFFHRAAATFIDSLVFGAACIAILIAWYGQEYLTAQVDSKAPLFGPVELALQIAGPILFCVVSWTVWGGTPGKRLLGLEGVDRSSFDPIGWGQALLRFFAYFISLAPLGLGFWWIVVSKQNRGWHDMIARTLVVHESDIEPHHVDDIEHQLRTPR